MPINFSLKLSSIAMPKATISLSGTEINTYCKVTSRDFWNLTSLVKAYV